MATNRMFSPIDEEHRHGRLPNRAAINEGTERFPMMNRKKLAAFAAAGSFAALLAFGALAPQVSFAQDAPTTSPMQGEWADQWSVRLAEQLGVTEAELQSAIDSVAAEILSQAVTESALTQEEADAISAALSAAVTDGAAGFGAEVRELVRVAREVDFDVQTAIADALGIDASTLRGNLVPGLLGGRGGPGGFGQGEFGMSGRAELTEEEQAAISARRAAVEALQPYLEAESFQNAITGAYQAAIDAAVADGALTAEEAATLEEQLSSENGFAFPGFGKHGGRGMGPGGMGGMERGGFGPRGGAPFGGAPNGDAPAAPTGNPENSTQG